MKQFNLIIKNIFVPTFVGVFLLGLSFVYSLEPNCGGIPSYSVNSVGGTAYNSDPSRYINQNNSMNLLIDNAVSSYCNRFDGWRKELCNSNPSNLLAIQQYQFNVLSLFMNKYNTENDDDIGPCGFSSTIGVGNCQLLVREAGCSTKNDCKLGNDTIAQILNCGVCNKINSNWRELRSYPNDCWEGYELTDNSLCCQYKVENSCANAPTITVEGGDTYNSNPKSVTIDYSANDDPNSLFAFGNYGNLSIEGGNHENIQFDTGTRIMTLDIVPLLEDEIKITATTGLGKIGEEECPSATKTLTLGNDCSTNSSFLIPNGADCCMPKEYREECFNDLEGQKIGYTGLDFSWLNGEICEVFDDNFGNVLEYEFCPGCDTPPVGGGCGYYSTGHGLNEAGDCCEECGSNEKVVDNKCVCDEEALDCGDGEKVGDDCECVCDPSIACCGIKLNTVVPFIGDCIEMTSQNSTQGARANSSYVNQLNAFPFLMMGLSKILVTVILIFSFLVVIIAGLMMVTGVTNEGNYKKGMDMIKNVVVALILLGSSGLILRLINPSFFGG